LNAVTAAESRARQGEHPVWGSKGRCQE